MSLPRFDHPPIVEVVCGITFESVPGLDPVRIGEYRSSRRDEYPKYEIHPALADEGEIYFGPAPQRVWLISADDNIVLQLQHDRFFLNWRRRTEAYPRFNDTDAGRGLLTRALGEFDAFSRFVSETLSTQLRPTRVELSKVDHLREQEHWEGRGDLLRLLPVLAGPLAIAGPGEERRAVAMQVVKPAPPGTITTSISTQARQEGDSLRAFVALESRFVRPVDDGSASLRETFVDCNRQLNATFERLIPAAEFGRFMKKGGI